MTPLALSMDDLCEEPRNPRTIEQSELDGLRASIERFGDIGGITWNNRTGKLIAGHQRVKILRELGGLLVSEGDRFEIRVSVGSKVWAFPVRVVDVDETEALAANISANNKHIAGSFDASLTALLDELRGSMGVAAFSEINLDALSVPAPAMNEKDESGMPDLGSNKTCICPECGHHFLMV